MRTKGDVGMHVAISGGVAGIQYEEKDGRLEATDEWLWEQIKLQPSAFGGGQIEFRHERPIFVQDEGTALRKLLPRVH